MSGTKRILTIGTMLLLVAILLSGLMVSPAMGQPGATAKVLIGFKSQPGRGEQALVRGVGGTIKNTYHIIPVIAATVPQGAIAALQANPNVAYVELDAVVHALEDELENSWGVERIGAGTVHDSANKGAGVKVAIIDSGIDYEHPDLDANCADENADGIIDGYDFVNDEVDPMDDYGHGTHVAGIVAAEDNDPDMGVVGVAPEAKLYALKVLDASGGGLSSYVIEALEWSILGPDGELDTGDEPGIQVINMSIGWSGSLQSLEDACDIAYDAGIVLVAAAGNWARTVPAAFDSVIAVAGSDEEDKIPAIWSNGNYIELTAPGWGVYSTWPLEVPSSTYDPQPVCVKGVCYKYGSGTSMASPHVAGTVALMIFGGSTDPDDIREELQATADKLTRIRNVEYPDSYQGFGLVDAEQAVLGTEFGDD